MRAQIIQHYITSVKKNEKFPKGVFNFCEELGISESDFYNEFSDLDEVNESILPELWTEVVSALDEQSFYQEASAGDKLLSTLYAFFEKLKENRSYFLISYKNWMNPQESVKGMKYFRSSFIEYAKLIQLDSTEFGVDVVDKNTAKLSHNALFANVLFVFHFWLNDRSQGFEKTDACIEKLFTLSLELIGNQTLKKAIDLGKFLFTQKK